MLASTVQFSKNRRQPRPVRRGETSSRPTWPVGSKTRAYARFLRTQQRAQPSFLVSSFPSSELAVLNRGVGLLAE
jgi:hypothetical protein